jgi:hypothetical protein
MFDQLTAQRDTIGGLASYSIGLLHLLFRWVAKHRHRCPARYPPLDSSSYEQGPHGLTHSNPLGKGGLSDEQDRSYCCQEKENAWIPSFSSNRNKHPDILILYRSKCTQPKRAHATSVVQSFGYLWYNLSVQSEEGRTTVIFRRQPSGEQS